MSTLVAHTGYLTSRLQRAVLRQPAYVVMLLIQPLIWLVLFGQLFKNVVEVPGFTGGSYIEFLVPGVVVMTVLFSAGWSGMAFIDDMERGVMDRMLTSPVSRGAMMTASMANQAIIVSVQAVVILLFGLLLGASYGGGLLGVLITLTAAFLLTAAFSSMSNGVALLVRQPESLIGFNTMLSLPLAFLSSAMMAREAAPEWIQTVSTCNPVDWAVVASREALSASPDWSDVLVRLGGLAAVAVAMGWVATRAFRAYQKSV